MLLTISETCLVVWIETSKLEQAKIHLQKALLTSAKPP